MINIAKIQGKQYSIDVGIVIKLNRIPYREGTILNFNNVIKVSKHTITRIKARGKIIDNEEGNKLIVFKHKRRNNYQRKIGKKILSSLIKIQSIK